MRRGVCGCVWGRWGSGSMVGDSHYSSCWNATMEDVRLPSCTHAHTHHLIADLLAEERRLCEGRLEISDFKWTRDEEISNFPPGCISVDWFAPRCTGSYPGTGINHRCQLQVTVDTPTCSCREGQKLECFPALWCRFA